MFIAEGHAVPLLIVALFYLRWPKSTHFGAKHRPELRTLGPAIAVSKLLGAQLRSFLRSWPALALVDESSKRGKVREVVGLRPYTSYALYSGHLTCRVEEKEGGGTRSLVPLARSHGSAGCPLFTRPYLTTIQRPRLDLKVALSNSKRSLCFSHALPLARALVPP